MDYNFWQSFGLYIVLFFVEKCYGYPLKSLEAGVAAGSPTLQAVPLLLSAALFVVMVMLLVGCLCCRQTKGFQHPKKNATVKKEFTDAVSTLDVSSPRPETIPFPPLPPSEPPVHFEPLPDIRPRRHAGLKPAPFAVPSPQASPAHWFDGASFPRSRLHYERELGGGWFGRVVAGQAQGLGPVVVKILREEAPPHEQRLFLQQAQAYRDLRHPNVLRVLGCCLEAQPLLVLLEDCSRGDLKSCLRENSAFPENGGVLRLACDVARGLQHMLDNGFVHTDLAARNCLVTSDLRVKVGDYGNGLDRFEQDYYIAGDVAVPIRWCAPETLDCTETTIHTKQVSPASNVWSLGVLLWEVAERGRLPYDWLTDDEVVGVVVGGNTRLPPPPKHSTPNADSLYQLMSRCWCVAADRPAIGQVVDMLDLLAAGAVDVKQFQQHCQSVGRASVDLFPPQQSGQEQDHEVESSVRDGARSPTSPQPSVESLEFHAAARSDSLANLRGSVDELDAACVDNVITTQAPATPSFDVRANTAVRSRDTAEFDSWLRCESTDGDSLFVREISAAIRDLDDALALEDSADTPRLRDASEFRLGRLEAAEEEMWRGRIERGEFSQKVKEKSRSVADLMVLTHIDASDTSDSEASMTWSFERNSNRTSFERGPLRTSLERGSVRISKTNKRSSLFGSDSDLRSIVLGDDFVESLQKIQVARRDSNKNLLSEVASFLREESKASEGAEGNAFGGGFLAIDASGDAVGGLVESPKESLKVPESRGTNGSSEDNTRRVIDTIEFSDVPYGQVTEMKLVRSGVESSVLDMKQVEPCAVFIHVDESQQLESAKASSKLQLDEDNSVSLDEMTLSEEPVTLMAPADVQKLSDDGDEPISLTLRDDTTSSDTSLAATSLEEIDEQCVSPRRKPVPRPRRCTIDTIEAPLIPAPRRPSLAAEHRLSGGSQEIVVESAEGRGKAAVDEVHPVGAVQLEGEETKTVNEILPLEEIVASKSHIGNDDSSYLIKVANDLVNETILKSIESVKERDSKRLMLIDNLNMGNIELSRSEDCTTKENNKTAINDIMKLSNDSGCLQDPAVSLPVFNNKTIPTEDDLLGIQDKSFQESSVILGACEDFTLDFFKGLKTTYGEHTSNDEDWHSLVEESARAGPLMKDSSSDGEFSDEYFPNSQNYEEDTGDSTPEEPIDYSKLNGFALNADAEQLLFTALHSEPAMNTKKTVSDIEEQLCFTSEPSGVANDCIINNDFNVLSFSTNLLPDTLSHIESKIEEKQPYSALDVVPMDLDVTKQLNAELLLSGKLPVLEISSEKSHVAIANVPEALILDDKMSVELANSIWSGSVEDIELDTELSYQRSNIECVSELADQSTPARTFADDRRLPTGDWNGFVDDADDEKESTDRLSRVEWHSDKSEDSVASHNPKVDDSYVDWASKESDLKAETFSDWEGKHEDDSKQATPDDERSSDSGFRDKGSLSESCEDEKYHLEDIEAELESFQKHELESDGDVVFNAEMRDCVEPLDFTFLRDRTEDDVMGDSLEGALPRGDSDLDTTLTDLDATLTPDQDALPADIYQPGSGSGWFLHPPEPSPERWGPAGAEVDFLAALRSELSDKLPNQSAPSDSESDSDCEDEPRRDVIIHYNTFQAPLSPILEEPWPDSPDAFFPRTFEQEVSAALDSLDSTSSADGVNTGSVRVEDLDSLARPVTVQATGRVALEDVLMIDVVTNEARLLDSPVPPPHVAFTARREGFADAADATYAIRNDARSAVSDSPGSEELSFCTPDASPSRVVEISVGAHDEAAMIVADLNESLRSRSLFNTCSDEYSQVSHPSLDADSSEDYSQSEDSHELDLSPVRRLDLLTLSHPSADAWDNSDAWERRMDGEDAWAEETRAMQITELGNLLKSRREPTTVAVSPNAASEMKQFVNGHRMEVNGNELKMFKMGKEPDWLDDIFNVASPSHLSGSSSASEYGIAAEEEGETLAENVHSVEPDSNESSLEAVSRDVACDTENLAKTNGCGIKVEAKTEKLYADNDLENGVKCADELGAKLAVIEDVDKSTSNEEETKIEMLKRLNSVGKEGADYESEVFVKSVKVCELDDKDLLLVGELGESELTKGKKSEISVDENEVLKDVDSEKAGQFVVAGKHNQPNNELQESETSLLEKLPSGVSSKSVDASIEVTDGQNIEVTSCNNSPAKDAAVRESTTDAGNKVTDLETEPAEVSANPAGADAEVNDEWTSMLAFTPADEHLVEMSTSFSAGDGGEDDEYAPDWETDSSSSGEFTWQEGDTDYADDPRNSVVAGTTSYDVSPRKPYECHSDFPMESIAEEDEDEDGSEDDDDEEEGSDGSSEEFVPSAWDSEATPTRSALRSPDKVSDNEDSLSEGKKNVTFKRQKYHCVYEYPRDVTEAEPSDPAPTDADYFGFTDDIQSDYQSFANEDPVNYQNFLREPPVSYVNFAKEAPVSYAGFSKETSKPAADFGLGAVDYSSYADWELNDGDGEDHDDEEEPEVARRRPATTQFDFYKLGGEEFGAGGADDGEFFVSSSSRPFAAFAPGQFTPSQFAPSQFFPGSCFEAPHSTGDTPPASPRSPSGLGELRHTRDRLKLHLPADLPVLTSIDSKRAAPDSDDSGVGSSHGAQTPAALQV